MQPLGEVQQAVCNKRPLIVSFAISSVINIEKHIEIVNSELVSAVWLSWCLAGRNGGRVGGTYARANILVAVLAGEGGLPTSRSMIEIQGIKFIHFWRRDRKVGVGPAIGRRQNFIENGLAFSID